ncbi:MAG: NADH-quinone oxidoreductase subunit C [Acidimicrobiales bacterium]
MTTDERVDTTRAAVFDALTSELELAGSHLALGDDLWIRVSRDAWVDTFKHLRDKHGCKWFDFLSAIDWMPSPFGRSMDSEVDTIVHGKDSKEPDAMATGVAGGETRFQLLARVYNVVEHWGVTVKADLPDDDLSIATLIPVFAGANWHEREAMEMFGIEFVGHPNPRKLYLPGAFEGFPLRKDFPLLARMVKPWPGIVDVEQMPGETEEEAEAGTEGGDAA